MNKHDSDYWLSVIIPAYNCSETICRLLDSIVIQDDDDIEVIICDDHSTDNFMDKVYPYMDKLNIKYCKTESRDIQCPSNTRLDGFKYATGEWVTFIDSDDMFNFNAFESVKSSILGNSNYPVLYGGVIIQDDEYDDRFNKMEESSDTFVYIHGKFFNRKWLIENNISFKENLYMTEDLYFNNSVLFALIGNDTTYIQDDSITYIKFRVTFFIVITFTINNWTEH